MSKLSGNKGEWSEIYSFLYILSTGRIYGADAKVNKIEEMYFDVTSVIRHEDDMEIIYRRDVKNSLIEVIKHDETKTVMIKDVSENCDLLFNTICNNNGGTFSVEEVENFMVDIGCNRIKAPSNDKTDITLVITDPRSGMDNIKLGFSIKSMIGSPSTLFNTSRQTKFKFNLVGNVTDKIINRINNRGKEKIREAYSVLKENNIEMKFDSMSSDTFRGNLELVDSRLPEIVAEMLKLHYLEGINKVSEQADILAKMNPLKFKGNDVPYYAYKIKKMLVAVTLGMQPSKIWDGKEEANGGYIIIRDNGDVLCYNIYNRNEFEEYLLNNTKFDTPSTKRYDFSNVYKDENGRFCIDLALQIRFL